MESARGATLVFGGQAGSEGKGAIVGYLARRYRYDVAVCTFMTNAGHTWMGDNGEKVVVQQLPMSIVSPVIKYLAVGPSSAITLEQLFKEIDLYDKQYNVSRRLIIDPRAMIIEERHREQESKGTKYIGSTMKGCGAALADKVMRSPDVKLARDIPELKRFLGDTVELVNKAADAGVGIMIEGSQGFDLDINHGIDYPQCTSRQCTPMQILADIGLDASHVTRNIAVIRSYPIRVGNIEEDGKIVGHSGSFGGKELSWQEVTERSGSPIPLEERTTVTQRVRRVFEIDYARLVRMGMITRPTDIALTFADYVDAELFGATSVYDKRGYSTSPKLDGYIDSIEGAMSVHTRNGRKPRVSLVKTGPNDGHMVDMVETEWASL